MPIKNIFKFPKFCFAERMWTPLFLFIIVTTSYSCNSNKEEKSFSTYCNPINIDYPIPSNDDAIKAIKLICTRIADAVVEGKAIKESGEAFTMEVPPETAELEVLEETHIFTPEEE